MLGDFGEWRVFAERIVRESRESLRSVVLQIFALKSGEFADRGTK